MFCQCLQLAGSSSYLSIFAHTHMHLLQDIYLGPIFTLSCILA